MNVLGLIGGMSWESTAEYYRRINQMVAAQLGGLHSAEVVLWSVDFAEIEALQRAGAWAEAGAALAAVAQRLERAGAAALVLCTNTMHCVADEISAATTLPLLHIADATGAAIQGAGLTTVGLLGTRFTMEQEFYRGRLTEQYGLTVLVPPPAARDIVHAVIYDELCRGQIIDSSRQALLGIMDDLVAQGVQGIILGCTELTLLLSAADTPLALFDTTALHCAAAVAWALEA